MIFKIVENSKIARRTWKMVLRGDTTDFWAPGQFVNILVPEKFLRRPISVADWTPGKEGSLTLLYDTVGSGTEIMSRMQPDTEIDLLTALGNGFDTDASDDCPALLGGGIGAAPMLALARELRDAGKKPVVLLGFNTAEDVILTEELEKMDIECRISTADGSFGERGFVTDLYRHVYEEREKEGLPALDYFYACGPNPMLRAVCREIEIPGEVSLDERMGCGFGVCLGCSVETKEGPKRACTEGPVFKKEILIWDK